MLNTILKKEMIIVFTKAVRKLGMVKYTGTASGPQRATPESPSGA